MTKNLYNLYQPNAPAVPILVSVPHSGTMIPPAIQSLIHPEIQSTLDDTDFYADQLYSFVNELGITLISATVSRVVIDLNRNKNDHRLYNDGRVTTGLVPLTDFRGQQIYSDPDYQPEPEEVNRRLKLFYFPYYDEIERVLSHFKINFGTALLWDAHSIRRHLPLISPDPFPDLILGTNDGSSADSQIIDTCLSSLHTSGMEVTHNDPFKGGNIIRHFGNPQKNIHAVQLEMSKDCYLDNQEIEMDQTKAPKMKKILRATLEQLIPILIK